MSKERFVVSTEHLKLIRRMNVGWNSCEFGAPEIDPKRPYGNSSVFQDMAEILGFDLFEDAYGEKHLSGGQMQLLSKLHQDTRIVLQIAIDTGEFQVGLYEREQYGGRWEHVNQ